jgi:hypothetical protein
MVESPAAKVEAGGRRCVFCSAPGPMTREHAIPTWLAGVLEDMEPGDGSPDWYTQYNAGGLVERDRQHPVGQPGVVVRAICEPCNTGWMSRMEAAMRLVIEPMIRGVKTALSLQEQLDVATWASKTVVALESHEPTVLVTLPDDRDLIRTQGRPPAHHQVRLACREAVSESLIIKTVVGRSEDAPDDKPDAFATLLGVGFLLVQVWGGHGSGGVGVTRAGTNNGKALMIWPPIPGAASWPPAIAIREEDLDAFAAEFVPWPDNSPGLEEWRQMRRVGDPE